MCKRSDEKFSQARASFPHHVLGIPLHVREELVSLSRGKKKRSRKKIFRHHKTYNVRKRRKWVKKKIKCMRKLLIHLVLLPGERVKEKFSYSAFIFKLPWEMNCGWIKWRKLKCHMWLLWKSLSKELSHDMLLQETREREEEKGWKYYEKWKFQPKLPLRCEDFLTSPHLHEQTAIFPWRILIRNHL